MMRSEPSSPTAGAAENALFGLRLCEFLWKFADNGVQSRVATVTIPG